MITVEEAYSIVVNNLYLSDEDNVNFDNSLGRYLREPIYSDRDFPPYDRVTMDGIALNFKAIDSGIKDFEVQAMLPAGSPKITLNTHQKCIEVMTGAVLPENCDTIIKYEDLELIETANIKRARIIVDEISRGQNVHTKGSDNTEGDELITSGTIITPAELQIIASVGKTKLNVSRLPKTAVISTGDELVNVENTPEPHQIRRSNNYAIGSSLKSFRINCDYFHLPDVESKVTRDLKEIFESYELIILSGGVSKGKLDYIPSALERLGVEKLFHKVSQRPGKPFWFGRTQNNFVFALPGNPVSTFMCYYKYLKPWLITSLGGKYIPKEVILAEEINFKPELTYFAPVTIDNKQGIIKAIPQLGSGSGDLTNLLLADGFVELPSGQSKFLKNESFMFHPYR